MNIFKSGASLAAANILSSLASFIVLSRLLTVLGLQEYAKVSVMLTYVAIFQIIFATQSWQGLLWKFSRMVPRNTLMAAFGIDAVSALFGASTLLACSWLFINGNDASTIAFVALNVFLMPYGATLAVIRLRGLYSQQAGIETLASALKLALVFVLDPEYVGPYYVVTVLVLPELIKWLGYVTLLTLHLKHTNVSGENEDVKASLREVYKFSSWGVFTEVIHLPAAHLDKLIVGAFLGAQSQAVWDLVKRCVTALVQVTNVVNQQLFPFYMRKLEISNYSRAAAYSHMLKSAKMMALTIFSVYLVAGLGFYEWFPPLFKLRQTELAQYSAKTNFMAFSAVMVFVLGAIPVHPLFLAIEGSKRNFTISAAANALNLVAALVLVPYLGVIGCILAIFISDGLIISFKLIRCRRWAAADTPDTAALGANI